MLYATLGHLGAFRPKSGLLCWTLPRLPITMSTELCDGERRDCKQSRSPFPGTESDSLSSRRHYV